MCFQQKYGFNLSDPLPCYHSIQQQNASIPPYPIGTVPPPSSCRAGKIDSYENQWLGIQT